MATKDIGEPIPSDVYHSINESLELKCLLDAHHEQLNEVIANIVTHYIYVLWAVKVGYFSHSHAYLNAYHFSTDIRFR